jgi:hypothetical protein
VLLRLAPAKGHPAPIFTSLLGVTKAGNTLQMGEKVLVLPFFTLAPANWIELTRSFLHGLGF